MSKKADKIRQLSVKAQELQSKIDIATQTLERNISFITNCDNKTSIVLAVIGVLLTIILTSDGLKKIHAIVKTCVERRTCCCTLYLVFLTLSICMMVYGMFCLVSVLIAKTSEDTHDFSSNDSHIFFAGIKKSGNYHSFHNEFVSMSAQDLLEELTAQIYINADIASIKYNKYNKGLKWSVVGFALFVTMLLIGIYFY